MRIAFLLVLFCTCLSLHAWAQDDQLDTLKESSKKPWYLTFALDLKYKSVKGSLNYDYQGEYYLYNNSNYESHWTWADSSRHDKNLLNVSSFYSPKLDVMLSRNRNLNFGMSYNMGVVQKNTGQYFSYEYYVYLAISGIVDYTYYLLPRVKRSPFVYGSAALGYYRATENISGPGHEYFGQGRIGFGYHNKKDWMFRIFLSQDMLMYRYKSESQVYQKPQDLKIGMNLLYAGFGVVRQFTLVPD